jgi:hypothetical protein
VSSRAEYTAVDQGVQLPAGLRPERSIVMVSENPSDVNVTATHRVPLNTATMCDDVGGCAPNDIVLSDVMVPGPGQRLLADGSTRFSIFAVLELLDAIGGNPPPPKLPSIFEMEVPFSTCFAVRSPLTVRSSV